MNDKLDEMFSRQWAAQAKVQVDPLTLEGEERIQYIKDMVLACTDELHEMLGEIGWKPWATSRHVNEAEAFGELRDAWQFLMNAMLAVTQRTPTVTAAMLNVAHAEKIELNLSRARNGYDGVSTKCLMCGRDLVENPPSEVPATAGLLPRIDVHCKCGHYLGSKPLV